MCVCPSLFPALCGRTSDHEEQARANMHHQGKENYHRAQLNKQEVDVEPVEADVKEVDHVPLKRAKSYSSHLCFALTPTTLRNRLILKIESHNHRSGGMKQNTSVGRMASSSR